MTLKTWRNKERRFPWDQREAPIAGVDAMGRRQHRKKSHFGLELMRLEVQRPQPTWRLVALVGTAE